MNILMNIDLQTNLDTQFKTCLYQYIHQVLQTNSQRISIILDSRLHITSKGPEHAVRFHCNMTDRGFVVNIDLTSNKYPGTPSMRTREPRYRVKYCPHQSPPRQSRTRTVGAPEPTIDAPKAFRIFAAVEFCLHAAPIVARPSHYISSRRAINRWNSRVAYIIHCRVIKILREKCANAARIGIGVG